MNFKNIWKSYYKDRLYVFLIYKEFLEIDYNPVKSKSIVALLEIIAYELNDTCAVVFIVD